MLIYKPCLRPYYGDVEGCVWVVSAMYTSISFTHDVVFTVVKASSLLFNDLSKPSRLSLASSVSHTKYMLSWWFEVSCHRVMLSVCSQGRVCISLLTHTLSHFVLILTFGSPFNTNLRWAPLHSFNAHWSCTAAQNCAKLEAISQAAYIA